MENKPECSKDEVRVFADGMNGLIWRSNALMVVNALLVPSMVVISASGWRYRRSTVIRFLSLGASTLFLPIASYVVSSIGSEYCQTAGMNVLCDDKKYVFLLLMWTVLIQTVGINFSAIVAINDGGGQKLGPSIDLLAKMLWISYLVFYYYSRGYQGPKSLREEYPPLTIKSLTLLSASLISLCVLGMVKITLKFYAFAKARRSFALWRNARLIAGYMEQLRGRPLDDEPIPPLIVMGEEKQQIEERPHGYIINCEMTNNSFVTLDRIWRMASTGDVLLERRPELKNLCLSFSLFKLLRRRFARCQLAEFGCTKPFNFIKDVLLNNGGPDRVFRVIADEVSFLGDSYYSSNPASNFGKLLPILNIIVSLCVILSLISALSVCLITSHLSFGNGGITETSGEQIRCYFLSCHVLGWADNDEDFINFGKDADFINFGSQFFYSLPTLFLLVAAILAEAWEIASYICSNWVKVTLICSYVTHASWQQSPCVHRWLGLVLRFRIKFIKSCSDQMGQVSLLPSRQPRTCCVRRDFFAVSGKIQHVQVPIEVKAAIVRALVSSNGSLSNGMVALENSGIGDGAFSALQGESTSDVILICHIATGIFEARHTASTGSSAHRTVAIYLSRYLVYLLEAAPELLPDDEAWSKKQYKAVMNYMQHLFSAWRRESLDYDEVIKLLGERPEQPEAVKTGVNLGTQLVREQDADRVWDVLARFWSEMILYVSPSDNLQAHQETIARGGELVTLVWALLSNAGIITRPSTRTAV